MGKARLNVREDMDDYLDADEMDSVKAAVAYILLNDSGMDLDTIYELVFQEGEKITWH
jgi:DNA-binding protein Fis